MSPTSVYNKTKERQAAEHGAPDNADSDWTAEQVEAYLVAFFNNSPYFGPGSLCQITGRSLAAVKALPARIFGHYDRGPNNVLFAKDYTPKLIRRDTEFTARDYQAINIALSTASKESGVATLAYLPARLARKLFRSEEELMDEYCYAVRQATKYSFQKITSFPVGELPRYLGYIRAYVGNFLYKE